LVDGTVHDTNQAKPSYQPEKEGTYTQEKKKGKEQERKRIILDLIMEKQGCRGGV